MTTQRPNKAALANKVAPTAALPAMLTAALAAAGVLASTDIARADLGWEHTGTLRVTAIKQPLLKIKMYNHWTAQRHRLLLKYSLGIPGMAGKMPPLNLPKGTIPTFAPQGFAPQAFATQPKTSQLSSALASALASISSAGSTRAFASGADTVAGGAAGGGFGPAALMRGLAPGLAAILPAMRGGQPSTSGALALVQRADDDRLVSYDSQSRRFVSEPRRALLQRLRFDPWKTLAPQLSREAPPTFTPEQRARLVEEMRAILSPIQRRVQKIYFRALTKTRTFQGIEGRGYRVTQLNNVGGFGKGQSQWMRSSFEWWVAGTREGDEAIRQFREASQENLRGIVFPTTSMWLNEYISLASLPAEPAWRRAMRTFMAPDDAPAGTLGATPLHIAVTVEMPPLQRATVGDIRFEMALTRRDTGELAGTVFDAPSDYKQLKTEPYLKKLDPLLNGSALNSLYDLALSQMK